MLETKIVEKFKRHISISNDFFLNRAVYKMWKIIVQADTSQMTLYYRAEIMQEYRHCYFQLTHCSLQGLLCDLG
jgi:hypothetical protein